MFSFLKLSINPDSPMIPKCSEFLSLFGQGRLLEETTGSMYRELLRNPPSIETKRHLSSDSMAFSETDHSQTDKDIISSFTSKKFQ
jgi:hypothetical protein